MNSEFADRTDSDALGAELVEAVESLIRVRSMMARLQERKEELTAEIIALLASRGSADLDIAGARHRVTVVSSEKARFNLHEARRLLAADVVAQIVSEYVDSAKFKDALRRGLIPDEFIDDILSFEQKKPYVRVTSVEEVVEAVRQRDTPAPIPLEI